jgi:hypothetical protein
MTMAHELPYEKNGLIGGRASWKARLSSRETVGLAQEIIAQLLKLGEKIIF